MMTRKYTCLPTVLHFAAAAALLHAMAAEGSSQLVIVRPGYVKAPFVRVYRNYDGSSTVRAPFVHVNPRPRYYVPPQGNVARRTSPGPPQSNGNDATDLRYVGWRQLRQSIRNSATALNDQLSRLPTGRVWQAHFKTSGILAAMGADNDVPPANDERTAVAALLTAFDQAQGNPDLQAVTRLSGFQTLHVGLQQYVQSPELRLRRQLSHGGQQLHRALAGFDTVSQWRTFLLTDFYAFVPPEGSPSPKAQATDIPRAVAGSDVSPGLPDDDGMNASRDILLKMLSRYDGVAIDPRYPMIARLAEFQYMHRRLRDFGTLPAQQPDPRVEELPPPPPKPTPAAPKPTPAVRQGS